MSKTTLKMTRTRSAVLAVLTASALTITGCSNDGDDKKDSKDDTSASDTDGDSGKDEDSDKDADKESEDKDSEDDQTADGDFPDMPKGFKPVKNGAKLKIGKEADVALPIKDGKYIYLKVKVEDAEELTPEEAESNAGGTLKDKEKYESLVCFPVSITPVGGDTEEFDSFDLSLKPVADNGRGANFLIGGSEQVCGIHEADALPTSDPVELDREYKSAAVSFNQKDGGGLKATGVALEGRGDEEIEIFFN